MKAIYPCCFALVRFEENYGKNARTCILTTSFEDFQHDYCGNPIERLRQAHLIGTEHALLQVLPRKEGKKKNGREQGSKRDKGRVKCRKNT